MEVTACQNSNRRARRASAAPQVGPSSVPHNPPSHARMQYALVCISEGSDPLPVTEDYLPELTTPSDDPFSLIDNAHGFDTSTSQPSGSTSRPSWRCELSEAYSMIRPSVTYPVGATLLQTGLGAADGGVVVGLTPWESVTHARSQGWLRHHWPQAGKELRMGCFMAWCTMSTDQPRTAAGGGRVYPYIRLQRVQRLEPSEEAVVRSNAVTVARPLSASGLGMVGLHQSGTLAVDRTPVPRQLRTAVVKRGSGGAGGITLTMGEGCGSAKALANRAAATEALEADVANMEKALATARGI